MSNPACLLPNLTMEPGAGDTTLDDLLAGVKRGFYVEDGGAFADQQVLNTQGGAGATSVRQIVNGKLGGYVKDFAFQYITQPFWRSVDGIGGQRTTESFLLSTDAEGDDLQPFPMSTIRAVPIRARQVNVLNTGRTA